MCKLNLRALFLSSRILHLLHGASYLNKLFSYWRVCSMAKHFMHYGEVKLSPHIYGFT